MLTTLIVCTWLALAPAAPQQGQQGQQSQQGQQGQQGQLDQQGQQQGLAQGQAAGQQQGQSRGQQQGTGQGTGQGVAQGRGGRGQGQTRLAVTVDASIYGADGQVTGSTMSGREGLSFFNSVNTGLYSAGRGRGFTVTVNDTVVCSGTAPVTGFVCINGAWVPPSSPVALAGRSGVGRASSIAPGVDAMAASTSIVGNGPTFCDARVANSQIEQMLNAWRVEVHPQSQTGNSIVALVSWQRVRANNQDVKSPAGSVTVTLHPGDRIPLDYISAGRTAGACQAVGMSLEVHMSVVHAAALPPAPDLTESDVWLVHTMPDGTEQSQRQTIRERPGSPAEYFFDDVTIASGDGDVSVRVSGSVNVRPNSDGTFSTTVGIDRVFLKGGARLGGGSASSVVTQQPNDVISFQMPPLGARAAGGRGMGAGRGVGAPGDTVQAALGRRGNLQGAIDSADLEKQLATVLNHTFALRVKTRVVK